MGSLRGRVRAMKAVSDSGSHTSSGSDIDAPSDPQHSSLVGQSKEKSHKNLSNEVNEEKDSESDISSQVSGNGSSEATSTSFGALMKAQASLGKRQRGYDDVIVEDANRFSQKHKASRNFISNEALGRRVGKKNIHDFTSTSKHAPAELSSKKAVSRKRDVVAMRKLNYRDPRFEPIGGFVNEPKTKKNYSFLKTYRDSEISELKSAISKISHSEGKEKLKRALLSMESREKVQEIKEQQQNVLRKHRKKEKEKIERGKRPFFLKKADQKKLALVERFEGMKSRQVDKVIEGRRRKKAARERRRMPNARRV